MNGFLISTAIAATLAAVPASAQILGGGGLGGGVGGTIGGTLGTIDRVRLPDTPRIDRDLPTRRERRGDLIDNRRTLLGERPIVAARVRGDSRVSLDQQMLRTRGAVSADRRGMRRVAPTRAGVQVFVPSVAVAAPEQPRAYYVHSYPAYSGAYYYGPSAVYVEDRYVDRYMDRHYVDVEMRLRGSGATVERRGDDIYITLPADVTFAFDRADIRQRFFGPLDGFVQTLLAYPGTDVEIIGHTDSAGSEAYNINLSERRGRSVADYLVARGVDPARLVVQAMGETQPVATNATPEGRAENRRVELVIHPRGG